MKKICLTIWFVLCLLSYRNFAFNKSNDDSLKIKKIKAEYEVALMEGINTKNSEFCAVTYSNELLFVTDQLKDLVNHESNEVNGFPYLDVFSTEIFNNKVKKKFPFSKQINGPFHDGPASFNKDQSQLYLTRVEHNNKKTKNYVNRAKLLVFKKKENGWSEPEAFKYNDDSYSTGHASVSKNGRYLFFTSDMPGGKGGKDIYVCKKNGAGWDKPENLGSEINTESDEEFPFIREDGILFFSSKGHEGLGGLDIFSANLLNKKWHLKRNEGAGINSEGDDFGIVFSDTAHGYFSSNRIGGVGGDDIYRFTFSEIPTTLSATLLLTENINDPAKNTLIYLLNNKGKVLDSTRTNKKGFFQFRNLNGEKECMVSVDPAELKLKGKARFYLANSKGEVIRVSHLFEKYKFVFDNLPLDKTGLSEIFQDEELSFEFNNCSYEHDKPILKEMVNKKIYLLNSKGLVISSLITDKKGRFKFNNLDVDKEYMISVAEDGLKFTGKKEYYLVNSKGVIVKVSSPFKNRKFIFRKISMDSLSLQETTVDDKLFLAGNLRFGPCGEELVKNTRICLVNSKGLVIDSMFTNEFGCFSFKNPAPDKNYTLRMNETDMHLPFNTKVILTDKNGKVVKIFRIGKDAFEYKTLSVEKNGLSQGETDTDDLTMKLHGYVYDRNKKVVANAKVVLYNSTGKQVQLLQTDINGKFSFSKTDIADHIEIVSLNKSDSILYIVDDKGRIRKQLKRNREGKFEYELLEIDKSVFGDLTIDDPWLNVVEMLPNSKSLTIIERIFYATNDYEVDSIGLRVLDKTISVLSANSKLILELSSHTDSRSNDTYNLKLSDKRAQYAVDYIVSKGIERSRLKAIGYGETKLLNKCMNNFNCSESEHAQNRRTEFKITYKK